MQVGLHIVQGNCFVPIDIITEVIAIVRRHRSITGLCLQIHQIRIMGIGDTVAADIVGQIQEIRAGGSGRSQRAGRAGHKIAIGMIFGSGIVFRLRHGVQVIVQVGFTKIMYLIAECIATALFRVIAQFRLRRIHALNAQISAGGDRLQNITQAAALLAGAVMQSGFLVIDQGARCTDQQMLHQFPDRQLRFGEIGPHILHHQSHHAGHMGRGHGGTAHQAVFIIVDGRVNIATGCGDIRLQRQIRRNAPGGEIADLAGKLAGQAGQILREGNGQFGIFSQQGDQIFTVFLQNGNAGDLSGTVCQIHAEFAFDIIVDDTGHSTGRLGSFALSCEGFHATHDQCDFSGQIQALIIFFRANARHQRQGVGRLLQCIDRRDLIAAAGFHEAQLSVAGRDITAHNERVFHAGHAEHVVVNTGLADNCVIRVHGLVFVIAPGVTIAGSIAIAGSNGQNRIGFRHAVVNSVDFL